MRILSTSLAAVASSVLLVAQAPDAAAVSASPMPVFDGVFVADPDAGADGTTWVRGRRYKLGLSSAGAEFRPLFGPTAARDWPVRFRLDGATVGGTALALDAATAAPAGWLRREHRFERTLGPVAERWDCAPDGAQQSFVVPQPVGAGAIALRVQCTTDLVIDGAGPGVTFRGPAALGDVSYGDAVVIDARGERLDLPVEVDGDTLVIVVPAAFAAGAAFPLVVDPLVTTVAVDPRVSDTKDARVAGNDLGTTWLVVAEEHLSATDVDIVCHRFSYASATGTPTPLETAFPDATPDFTHNPDVACLTQTQHFVVAWHNASTTLANGLFQWRTRASGSNGQGPVVNTGQGVGTDLANRPVVGGAQTGDRFLLVMFRKTTAGTDAQVTLFRNTGSTVASFPLAAPVGTMVAGDVSVSQGMADGWVVVWHECLGFGCILANVRMQEVRATTSVAGLVLMPPIDLVLGAPVLAPRIAGRNGNLLVVWSLSNLGDLDIFGQLLHRPAGSIVPNGGPQNLSLGEPGVTPGRAQRRPSASYDGVRFVYGYAEDEPGGLVRPYAATVLVEGTTIHRHEGHLLLAPPGTTTIGASLDLAFGNRANAGHHWAVWDQPGAGTATDLVGAVVDARQPGATAVVAQTGCGSPTEPSLTLTGTPALGRSIGVALPNAAGVPFLLVGDESVAPLSGCGTCRSGVLLAGAQTYATSSLGVTWPVSPAFVGFRIAFQGVVLNQAGGCPPSVFGVPFAVTDTLTVQVR
jgi:hypothetical protein